MNINTLPDRPIDALADYWEHALDREFHEVDVLPPAKTPMRLLNHIELATLQAVVVPRSGTPPTFSTLGESGIRLAIFHERNLLQYMSADHLARTLQFVFWPHARLAQRPWRGLDLLRLIDEHSEETGVQFWLSAEPTTEAANHFRRMRLSDRIAELAEARS